MSCDNCREIIGQEEKDIDVPIYEFEYCRFCLEESCEHQEFYFDKEKKDESRISGRMIYCQFCNTVWTEEDGIWKESYAC